MNITKIAAQTMLTEMTILYVDKSYYVSSEYPHTFAFAFTVAFTFVFAFALALAFPQTRFSILNL